MLSQNNNASPVGAAPSQPVEEEGAITPLQERQQPQGLPAGGGQLAALQLVQQVSFKRQTVYMLQQMLFWLFD